ncbi:MAG: class I SAM-dependent methyltransferase [Chloroflexi bacterium]|nr:class I SAM-dependent methyltransferase [Chloroflexota bacterium]
MTNAVNQERLAEELDPWRGVSFSGVTLVLGTGTGRQVPLLAEKIRQAEGLLVVADVATAHLDALREQLVAPDIAWVQARARSIPLLHESVDLLLLNGLLRELPTERFGLLFEELWRTLVPGGQLRIADILDASEDPAHHAWAERNRIVRRLGLALRRPVAVSVDLRAAVRLLRGTGFEEMRATLLPGYILTDAWLQETAEAIHGMAGRVVDANLRRLILNEDIERLAQAYMQGEQRAPERFVLQAVKPGDLSVAMESPFTESDLNIPLD